MTLILKKGANINLSKEAPNVELFTLGLGWEPNVEKGKQFDLDASLFLLDSNGKIVNGDDLNTIYYGNKTSKCGSVIHTGDNVTGEGDGDDERIKIDFSKLPQETEVVKAVINIYEAESRGQCFGQVRDAYARVFKTETEEEVCKYDLTEDHSSATAFHIADFYKRNGEWKFRAVGIGSEKTLKDFMAEAGVQAS